MSVGHTELAACPFCGGEATFEKALYGRPVMRWIKCKNCGAGSSSFNSATSAITAWNTRAIEAAEADLLGRALAALRMAAPLLAEAREALCGRDDVCTTSDGDDALLPLRDAINFILSQAREVK